MTFHNYSQNLLISKRNDDFHRSQKLVINDGLLMEQDLKLNQRRNYVMDRLSKESIDLNKHVLSFDAYYQDARKASIDKSSLCKILYYLDDDTIKVCEPDYSAKILNRGCIIPKQRLKKKKFFSSKDEYYTIEDLNIGNSLDIFGVKYTLINCDCFTREFLDNLGYKIQSSQPEYTFLLNELQVKEQKKPICRKFFPKSYAIAKFLEEYPKTLRFYGAWEDVTSYGNKKYLVTLYINIADGTFKVLENRPLNFRDHDSRLLLKPTLVPKNILPDNIGQKGEKTVLNLCSNVCFDRTDNKCIEYKQPSFILDSNPVKEKYLDYLTEKDIELGSYLNVFGHQLYLYDCDDFTKQYYYSKYKKSLMPLPKPAISKNNII